MKHLYLLLSVVLLSLAACTQFLEDTPKQFAGVSNPQIELVKNVADTIVVNITAPTNAQYLSYLVLEGEYQSLAPENILTLAYADNAVVVIEENEDGEKVEVSLADCLKISDGDSFDVKVYGLKEYSYYTVYAVASNADGVVSELVYTSVLSKDDTAPAVIESSFDDSKLEEGVLSFKFDDNVRLSNAFEGGSAKISIIYYAENVVVDKEYVPIETFEVPSDSVSLVGRTLTIQGIPIVAGAIVDVAIAEGVVVNDVQEANKEYVDGELYSQFEYKNWDFAPLNKEGEVCKEDEMLYFKDWESTSIQLAAQKLVKSEVNKLTPTKDQKVTVRYNLGNNRFSTYVAKNTTVSEDGSQLVIALEDPVDIGVYVSVDVAAGSYEDIWGNPCNAFSNYSASDGLYGNHFCSYGYSKEDFYGVYSYTASTKYVEYFEGDGVLIAPYPEVADSVLIYDLFTTTICMDDLDGYMPLPSTQSVTAGKINIHSGVISVDYHIIGIGLYEKSNWNNYVFAVADNDGSLGNYALQMPQKGTIVNAVPIYMYCNGLGTWDIYNELILTKTAEFSEELIPTDPDE